MTGRAVRGGSGGQRVAEDLPEHRLHDGMQAFLGEAGGGIGGLPHVDVVQSPLGPFHRQVHDQPRRHLITEAVTMRW